MTGPDVEATADAFNSLSDPVRVELLCELWLEGRHDTVAFTELQDAVGVRDSGRFNYHLTRLVGQFIEKDGGGYRLTAAGLAVVDAVQSEMFTAAASVSPQPVDGECPRCGVLLEAAYDAGEFRVACPDCDLLASRFFFPPRGVHVRDQADAARAHAVDARSRAERAALGLCPYCGGRTDTTVERTDPTDDHDARVHHECEDCEGRVSSSVGSYAHREPAVVGFCHDHGVDPRGPAWQFPWCLDPGAVELSGRDPLRVEVCVELGDDELRIAFDESGGVVSEERIRRQ
jgi:hypothetical protein